MAKPRFTPEFKAEAIKQITERGYSVKDVSERLAFQITVFTTGSSNISKRPNLILWSRSSRI